MDDKTNKISCESKKDRSAFAATQSNQSIHRQHEEAWFCHAWNQKGGLGVRTPPPPQKNHNYIGFLSNTGSDLLENHKVTKPVFNVGPSLAHQRNTFKWCFAGGLMMASF